MKVLHVYRTYFPDAPGGLQEAIRQIALSTKPEVESRVFALSRHPSPKRLERPEATVIRAKSWGAPASCDLGLLDSVREFSAQVAWADIVHYHFPWPFADLLHFAVRPKKPCVMTYHSDVVQKGVLGRLYEPLMGRMLSSMDAVVATSPRYLETSPYLKKWVRSERQHVIPLGISEASYRPYLDESDNIRLSERFGLSGDGYFLFLGALRGYKGIHVLADAVRDTDLPVVIAGDGGLSDQVRALCESSPNVTWVGNVTDAEKVALLRGCLGLVLPSHLRSEAFGMVLVEAQMYGKPLISTELGTGTTFVNQDGVTGLTVPGGDSDSLRDAMVALKNDPRKANRMGQAGRARYEALFSGEALGAAYARLYETLLSARSGSV